MRTLEYSYADIAEYLDEVLELDPPARASWLDALAARAPEVAVRVGAFLAELSELERQGYLRHTSVAHTLATTLVGQRFGAYTLDEQLGHGGMGTVWLAHRSDGLFEGRAAVKLLNTALVGHPAEQRFTREGSVLARLQHPNIARLLDAGVTATRHPYLVLELVEGVRIDRYCDTQRLDTRARVQLFTGVLNAIAHAHSHLVIHRDIKPSNVLITADGTVKLLDFGIARLLEGESDATTLVDQRALTPDYAAPEQFTGGAVTTATDVYGLGTLLYVLLCGRHPLGATEASAVEKMRAVLESQPQRLASVLAQPSYTAAGVELREIAAQRGTSVSRLRRELSGDLENIVARCLRKDPTARYQTATALAEDLQRYLTRQPVRARPDSLLYRSGRFVQRNLGMVAAGVMLFAAIAAGVVSTVHQTRRAEAQTVVAQKERDRALEELITARASTDLLEQLLEEVGNRPFTTSALLERGEAVVSQQYREDPVRRAVLNLLLSVVYSQTGRPQKGVEVMERALAAAKLTTRVGLQADIECQLAMVRVETGALIDARPVLDAAMARLRAEPEPDINALANCFISSSTVNLLQGKAKEGLADAQAGLQVLGVPGIQNRTDFLLLRSLEAFAQQLLGNTGAAVAGYEWVIAELSAMGRGQTESARAMAGNLALLLSNAGQTLKAAAVLEQGRRVRLDADRQSINSTAEATYGITLIDLGRFKEAQDVLEQAWADANATNSRLVAGSLAVYGAPAWCATNELTRCAEWLKSARPLMEGVVPPQHSRWAGLELGEGQLALARGDTAAALMRLRKSVALFDAATDRNTSLIQALALLSRAELESGDLQSARTQAARAVALAQAERISSGFPHNALLGYALIAHGLSEQAADQLAAARASWQAAVEELNPTLGEAAPATREAAALLAALER